MFPHLDMVSVANRCCCRKNAVTFSRDWKSNYQNSGIPWENTEALSIPSAVLSEYELPIILVPTFSSSIGRQCIFHFIDEKMIRNYQYQRRTCHYKLHRIPFLTFSNNKRMPLIGSEIWTSHSTFQIKLVHINIM